MGQRSDFAPLHSPGAALERERERVQVKTPSDLQTSSASPNAAAAPRRSCTTACASSPQLMKEPGFRGLSPTLWWEDNAARQRRGSSLEAPGGEGTTVES